MNESLHTRTPDGTLRGPKRQPVAAMAGGRAMYVHTVVAGGMAGLLIVIWLATTRSYFWPVWAMLPLALTLAMHRWLRLASANRARWSRGRWTPAFANHVGISGIIWLFLVGIWIASGAGYFWPIWPLVGLAIAVGIHRLVLLTHRVETLEHRRAGAVQVQESDLRRIERDLHDGAQARLVALGMNLGLAEQKLATDPEGARALVAEARQGVGDALTELRDLVRGIRPPVLADRGLEAAIATLADRSPLDVQVSGRVDPRPSDAVETAAYFVVAEALANAAKHAGASRVDVRLERYETMLTVQVTDNGRGGADADGQGLTGLRQRVEALDGVLVVLSPGGGPTVLRAELPCGR